MSQNCLKEDTHVPLVRALYYKAGGTAFAWSVPELWLVSELSFGRWSAFSRANAAGTMLPGNMLLIDVHRSKGGLDEGLTSAWTSALCSVDCRC